MNILKYFSIFLLLTMSLMACTSGRVISANKKLVSPGARNSKKYLNYELVIEVKKEFSINKVSTKKGGKAIGFSVLELATGAHLNRTSDLKPGQYKLTFVGDLKDKDVNNEVVYVVCKIDGSDKTLRKKVEVKTPEFGR